MSALTLLGGLVLSLAVTVAPTLFWSLFLWWIDRYEREPWALALLAFLWGAIPAIVISLIFEMLWDVPVGQAASPLLADLASSSLAAPFIEEIAKAFALLLLLLVGRHEFDDVFDGIVYGALIGFGFAMTENLFYFMSALSEGGWGGWGATVVLRSVIFGFNHAIFTACTGAGVGYAVAAGRLGRFWAPLLGFATALGLHAVHNLGATLAQVSAASVLLSFFNGLGGLMLVVILLVLAWQRQARWLREGLADEVGEWLPAEVYARLLTLQGRRELLAAAQAVGGASGRRRAQLFQERASKLAFRKMRLRRTADPQLAQQVAGLRTQLRAAAPYLPAT